MPQPPETQDDAHRHNEAATVRAGQDPAAVCLAAMDSEAVRDRLNALAASQHDQAPRAGLALAALNLLRVMSGRGAWSADISLPITIKPLPPEHPGKATACPDGPRMETGRAVIPDAATICGLLAELPAGAGLSLLALAVEGMPEDIEPFIPRPRASLPRWDRVTEIADPDRLHFPSTAPRELGGQYLMDLGDSLDRSWLLDMYARAGGPIDQGGRLPFALHFAVGAMVHLPIERRDFEWHKLRFPHTRKHAKDWPRRADGKPVPSIEEWLYGDHGFPNPWRDWQNIPKGLDDMRGKLVYLAIQGLGDVAWAFPSVIPRTRDDPLVEFTLRIHPQAARGARMDWRRFQHYAAQSATLARAYLAAVDIMGHSQSRGHPQTRQIAKPLLNADGTAKRGKQGHVLRSKTEQIENRHARYVRRLSELDLAQMCGFDIPRRDQRARAREAFKKLHDDGVIELHREDGGFRIFGPQPGRQ